MDLLALLALLIVLVCFVAPAAGGLVAWARGEWQLIRANTWQGDHLVNPALGSAREDIAVAHTEAMQYELGQRLRRQRRTLLDEKKYVPALTKPAPAEPPPKADKVAPIRKPQT
jgi:hypothetical protein